MTCNDCIHATVCADRADKFIETFTTGKGVETVCEHFHEIQTQYVTPAMTVSIPCPECNGIGRIVSFEEVSRVGEMVTLQTNTAPCPTCKGTGYAPMTNADRIRAMFATDEGIAKILLTLDISLAEDGREFTHLYCDGKNNCITEDDDIICTDEMRTACILRWLQQPAKEE